MAGQLGMCEDARSVIPRWRDRAWCARAQSRISVMSTASKGPVGPLGEEVMAEESPRYCVRWDDGHTTVFAPAAGAIWIEERKKTSLKRARRPTLRPWLSRRPGTTD